MTDSANTDAALVRAAMLYDRPTTQEDFDALDRLAAAAERAEQAERDAGQAWTEYNDSEAALLAAQQERDEAVCTVWSERGIMVDLTNRAERAEATNTRLREAAKTLLSYWEPPERGTKAYDYWEPPDGKTTRRILDDFRAALALDAEQENA